MLCCKWLHFQKIIVKYKKVYFTKIKYIIILMIFFFHTVFEKKKKKIDIVEKIQNVDSAVVRCWVLIFALSSIQALVIDECFYIKLRFFVLKIREKTKTKNSRPLLKKKEKRFLVVVAAKQIDCKKQYLLFNFRLWHFRFILKVNTLKNIYTNFQHVFLKA